MIGIWIGWTFRAGPMLVAAALAFTLTAVFGQSGGGVTHELMGQSTLLCATLEIAALLGLAVRLLADDRRRADAPSRPRTALPDGASPVRADAMRQIRR